MNKPSTSSPITDGEHTWVLTSKNQTIMINMKNSRRKHFLVGALVFLYALASTTTQAQDKPTFDGSFTLADNHPVPPDGSVQAREGDDQVNQSKPSWPRNLQNPVASLISVPIQNNWDCGHRPRRNAMKYTANIQPVVPLFHQRGLEPHHPHHHAGHLP